MTFSADAFSGLFGLFVLPKGLGLTGGKGLAAPPKNSSPLSDLGFEFLVFYPQAS